MKILKSKIGYVLVGIYIILSAVSIIYSRICNREICDVGYLLLPSLPWITLFNGGSFELVFYIASIILNIIVIYLIGYLIGLTIKKLKATKRR